MKICIIGNSHLAALKLAWDELKNDYKQVELVFFGARSQQLSNLEVQDDCLVATTQQTRRELFITSGGQEQIDFRGFDAIWLYGLCHIEMIADALMTHRSFSMNDESRKIMSQACVTQICMDRLKEQLLFRTASLVRQISKIPLYVSPAPFPSQSCRETNMKRWLFLKFTSDQIIQESYYKAISEVCRSFQGDLLIQPETTVVDYLFSKESFSTDSVCLTPDFLTKHYERDKAHMNKSYGREVLQSALNSMHKQTSV